MVMRKILFGTVVFFSLAFLAACGGGSAGTSGSSGDAGATGATGDTGATGSISVPTDSDLAITLNGRLDIDSTELDYQNTITISGLDNESMDSRLRYGKMTCLFVLLPQSQGRNLKLPWRANVQLLL